MYVLPEAFPTEGVSSACFSLHRSADFSNVRLMIFLQRLLYAFHSESSFLSHTQEPLVVMHGEGEMERGGDGERREGGERKMGEMHVQRRKRKREDREERRMKYIHRGEEDSIYTPKRLVLANTDSQHERGLWLESHL